MGSAWVFDDPSRASLRHLKRLFLNHDYEIPDEKGTIKDDIFLNKHRDCKKEDRTDRKGDA